MINQKNSTTRKNTEVKRSNKQLFFLDEQDQKLGQTINKKNSSSG